MVVIIIIFYIAHHSYEFLCCSHWTNYSKTLHKAMSGFQKVNSVEWREQGIGYGWDDWGESMQLGTWVSGILLQDPNASQYHL